MATSVVLSQQARLLEAAMLSSHIVPDDLGGFTGFPVGATFDSSVTCNSADELRSQVETWKNAGGVDRVELLCDWDGKSNFTNDTLRGPSSSNLTANPNVFGGFERPSGGILIRPATGRSPAFGNPIRVYGMPLFELRGITLASLAEGGNGDNIRCIQFQTTSTYPIPNAFAINNCKIGAEFLDSGISFSEYVKGISCTGTNLSAHFEGNEAHGARDLFASNALYHRVLKNNGRRVISDFSTTFGYTSSEYLGRRVNVLVQQNTELAAVDDISLSELHQDFHQTGTPADAHEGYSVLARFNMIIKSADLAGGTQGMYNDDHLTAKNEFLTHNNLVCTTSVGAITTWNTDPSLSSFIESNTIMAPEFRPVTQDTRLGFRTINPATPAYDTLRVSNNILSIVFDVASVITEEVDNLYVDPRRDIASGGTGLDDTSPLRPEEVFSGSFNRDNDDFLTYSIPEVISGDYQQAFDAIVAFFEPIGGWDSLQQGISDPTGWQSYIDSTLPSPVTYVDSLPFTFTVQPVTPPVGLPLASKVLYLKTQGII